MLSNNLCPKGLHRHLLRNPWRAGASLGSLSEGYGSPLFNVLQCDPSGAARANTCARQPRNSLSNSRKSSQTLARVPKPKLPDRACIAIGYALVLFAGTPHDFCLLPVVVNFVPSSSPRCLNVNRRFTFSPIALKHRDRQRGCALRHGGLLLRYCASSGFGSSRIAGTLQESRPWHLGAASRSRPPGGVP